MATFILNISLPSMLSPKTNILPHKSLSLTPNLSIKTNSLDGFAITKCYQNGKSASIACQELENQVLDYGLQAESMPKHVAMIVDKEGDLLPELSCVGRNWLIEIAKFCCELGIKVLSVHTCSSAKKKDEAGFAANITKLDLEELSRFDIRVSVIGNRNTIPDSLVEIITQLEEATKKNKSLHIIETLNYTGHYDIIQSCMVLAEKVNNGLLQPEEIDDNVFQQELLTKYSEFPNPDLMIRTGGKSNVGNFMLWQSAYAEMCLVEKDVIQFNKMDFIEALKVYQKRNRRFGGSDETTKRK